jgi:hypothetical protein
VIAQNAQTSQGAPTEARPFLLGGTSACWREEFAVSLSRQRHNFSLTVFIIHGPTGHLSSPRDTSPGHSATV